ncbi:calcium-binding protein, partial [Paracoccus sp. M683]|uniref:calcium-binding protein n=2 Tax=Paracoccus TaxID=265 RepID=UPI0011808F24
MPTFNGTAGNDTLLGSEGDDLINGLDGDDRLSGIFGVDRLLGGAGADRLTDSTFGLLDPGTDTLDGGAGNDTISSYSGSDIVFGGEGNDIINMLNPGQIFAGIGNDRISFMGGHVVAGAGNDTIGLDIAPSGPVDTTINAGGEFDRVDVKHLLTDPLTLDLRGGREGTGSTIAIWSAESVGYEGESQDLTILDGSRSTRLAVEYDVWGGSQVTGDRMATLRMGGGNDVVNVSYYAFDVRMGRGDDRFSADLSSGGRVDGGAGTDLLTIYTLAKPGETVVIDARPGATANDSAFMVVSGFEEVMLSGDDYVPGLPSGWLHYFGGDEAVLLEIYGGSTKAVLGNGADVVGFGRSGAVIDLNTGGGQDSIFAAEPDPDIVSGVIRAGAGDDHIAIKQFFGTIMGGTGNDLIELSSDLPGAFRTTIYGGQGNDTIKGNDTFGGDSTGRLLIDGGAGRDSLSGGDGNDALFGRQGADVLLGGAGNDTLQGGVGADQLLGGTGKDRARYADAAAAVVVDLVTPANNRGDAAGDVLTSIENISGSNHNDGLFGDAGDNVLWGEKGKDRLDGRGGSDTL